jgi:hypothetical protein
VRLIGAAFEFRVELNPHEKTVSGQFDRFNEVFIGRYAAYSQAFAGNNFTVIVVELKAVAVPFAYFIIAAYIVRVIQFV